MELEKITPALPGLSTRNEIIQSLGSYSQDYSKNTPLELHLTLLNKQPGDDNISHFSEGDMFTVGGADFWWVYPTDNSFLNDEVSLENHSLVEPNRYIRKSTVEALKIISKVDWAFSVVKNYSPAFGFLKLDDKDARPITSCSVPDFPTISFFSDIALRHIPPLSVHGGDSNYILAENIFHESVHQYVNHQILTQGILSASYTSESSPMIDIPWRKNKDGSIQKWQIDRVLHAAVVYTNLLNWRLEALKSLENDKDNLLTFFADSLPYARNSVINLYKALEDNLDCFTLKGANRIGSLSNQALVAMSKLSEMNIAIEK